MDTIAKRFPHLAVNISNNLDDQSLVKFKEANRENSEFMIQNPFYWIRILKKYNDYFETSNESWKKSISNTPIEFVRKLAMAALNFFKTASEDIEDFIEVHFHPRNKEPLTPLHIAAYDGDLNFFQEVKKITFTINQNLNQSQIAPIHLAAYRGHIALCKQLLEEWDKIWDTYGKYEAVGLLYAAVAGHLEVYKLFHTVQEIKIHKLKCVCSYISRGIMPDQHVHMLLRVPIYFWDEKTPFHYAAEKGHTEICKFIIERAEDKHPTDIDGRTPLHLAVLNGHLDICCTIIDNVANKNPADNNGVTPLHLAAESGHLDICSIIVDNICCIIMDNVTNLNPADNAGKTPLHLAAKNGHLNICKIIIDSILDKNTIREEHKNPADKGQLQIFDFNNEKNPRDCRGVTPLHLAADNGHLDIYKLIFENVDKKNPTSDDGNAPLHYAAIGGHLNVCKFIMAHIEDMNPKNSEGETPMDIAKERNQIYIIQLFRLAAIHKVTEYGLCAMALYDFQAFEEAEISFDSGDFITHIDQIDSGWCQGLRPDGKYGLFPADYVQVVDPSSIPA